MIIKTDFDPKEIEEFKSLKISEKYIIGDSPKIVQKLIDEKIVIHKLLCSEKYFKTFKKSELVKIVYIQTLLKLKEITGFNLHHGVMALAEHPKLKSLEELKPPYLILNGLTSPENIGTIIRTASAFNINSIIIDKNTVSPYIRRAIRVSMGNIFFVNIHKTNNLLSTLKILKSKNIEILSAANEHNSLNIHSENFHKNSAVIIGSEGHGIDRDILLASDKVIKIPILEKVAHINASCAASVFLSKLSFDSNLLNI